jgi:hypothetical protein
MGDVLRVRDLPPGRPSELLAPLGLSLSLVASDAPIPNSYWGESEAGIDAQGLWARADTPVHSLLHEASHWVCVTHLGRAMAAGDASCDDAEECAVCYLQVLLADAWPAPVSRTRLFADMDDWGYSFREGSAACWFEGDGEDARQWLVAHGIIDQQGALLMTTDSAQSLVGLGASP